VLAPSGWRAIHLSLIAAAHGFSNRQTDLVALATFAVEVAHRAGYTSLESERHTRFVGSGITNWQTQLYAVNNLSEWRFPDPILPVGWLVECGGPKMARGPARADFEANGVELMIGGTCWRYNNRGYGHGGEGLPESREYMPADCVHMSASLSAVLSGRR
jgi:hypothetical protein